MASSSSPIGSAMLSEFPEVEDFLKMKQKSEAKNLNYNNQSYNEENIFEADSSFFDFFTIPVLRGDPGSLPDSKEKIVITVSVVKKIFGDNNPVGNLIKAGRDMTSFVVSGIMEDVPGNSHLSAGAVISII